jgi:hypothetical protein
MQQPDNTPPRGGNRVSDKISPIQFHSYMQQRFLLAFARPPNWPNFKLFDCYTLAQTTGLMNNYLVPEALNGYGVHI